MSRADQTLKLPAMYDSLSESPGQGANFVPLTPIGFLSRTADVYPDTTSLIYQSQRYTWSQTEQRCQQLAHALKRLGIGAHDTVSVLAFNTPETFEAHFFVPMAGAVLNTINTRLDEETVRYILNFAEAKAVLVDRELLPLAIQGIRDRAEAGNPVPVILIDDPHAATQPEIPDDLSIYLYEELLNKPVKRSEYLPYQVANELQPLAINFTSGTSGNPKGVVYHHRGSYLMSMGTIAGWPLPLHPTYLYAVPLFHCNGWGHPWLMTMLGGTVVFTRTPAADLILEAIRTHGVTHFGAAPIVLQMLIEAKSASAPFDPAIRVMTAGAPPPPSILEKTRAMGFDVIQPYGLTETYGHISQCLWQEDWNDLTPAEQAELQAQQGIAFPMVEEVAVIDRASGAPVPRDGTTQGEIAIRGNTVMAGYYKDADATAAAFADGWFWSGDGAVVHDNAYIQIRDRLKDVIISGGENISSVEVEAVIYDHPAVLAAAVIAKPDPKWGEVPCAFVELVGGETVDATALRAWCKEQLASYKVPGQFVFMPIPRTSTGKIQKFVLRAHAKKLA